jgi:hypothetical protein
MTLEITDVSDTEYRLTVSSHSGRFCEIDAAGNGVVSIIVAKGDDALPVEVRG